MSSIEISFKNVINARVFVDNSTDSEREMDISASVNIIDGRAESFQNGQCVKHPDGETTGGSATFSLSNGHFAICFNNVGSSDLMSEMQRYVYNFIHSFDQLEVSVTASIPQ